MISRTVCATNESYRDNALHSKSCKADKDDCPDESPASTFWLGSVVYAGNGGALPKPWLSYMFELRRHNAFAIQASDTKIYQKIPETEDQIIQDNTSEESLQPHSRDP